MSLKLKALGLGLLATLAMSAMWAVNASATKNGHFTNEAVDGHAILDITEGSADGEVHTPEFRAFSDEPVMCEPSKVSYVATVSKATTDEITVTPTYGTTPTTDWTNHPTHCAAGTNKAVIHMNGCFYVFTSRTLPNHGTVHLNCPVGSPGPEITVDSPASSHHCYIRITPNQTPGGGLVYTTKGVQGAGHELTVDITATGIHAEIVTGGFFSCGTFSTTTSEATFTGSVTVKGTNTAGEQVGITAT